jgi:mannosyltransferase OCH1-like enzyme
MKTQFIFFLLTVIVSIFLTAKLLAPVLDQKFMLPDHPFQEEDLSDVNANSPYKIPNIVHYIFGLKAYFEGVPFRFYQYLSIKSAHDVLKPEKMYLHYVFEPKGKWWEAAKKYLTLNKITLSTAIHGSDVLRLQVLHKHGGIYLDTNVFVLKSFDPLRRYEAVMGSVGPSGTMGLDNSIILAAPQSPWVQLYLDNIQRLSADDYTSHSRLLPKMLADSHPNLIRVLNHRQFFWPLCLEHERKKIYRYFTYDYSKQFAIRLWDSQELQALTPAHLVHPSTTLEKIARRISRDY